MGKDLFDLSGRVAVVTGGSRGLGREMVLAFAERGADVVIASRKLDACESVARRGRGAGSTGAPGGVSRRQMGRQPTGSTTRCTREFGRCDILVNNAGMSPLYPSVDAISEALYDKVMDVNLKGPFRLSALVGTRMAGPDHGGSNGGSIIFVSSIASHRPSPNELVYGAAKAGINNLTYGLARTLGPKVRVNCIAPGPLPHRHLQGVGPRRVRTIGEGRVRVGSRRRTPRDRRHRALPRERRVVVHDRRRDRRRRRATLKRTAVRHRST